MKVSRCFPQNGRFRDQTGGLETTSQNGSLPFKTGELECMNLFDYEKVFQISGIVLATEQSIKSFTFIFQGFYLNFKSTCTIFKEFINSFWSDFRRIPLDGCYSMFYIAIDYENETYMEVAASNINIKIHQLFSKQPILGVHVTIVQRKISGDLTQTCFWITCRPYLWK